MYSLFACLAVAASVLALVCVLPTTKNLPTSAGAMAMAIMSVAMIDVIQIPGSILSRPGWAALLILSAPTLTLFGRIRPLPEGAPTTTDVMGMHRSFTMIAMGLMLLLSVNEGSAAVHTAHGHQSGTWPGLTTLVWVAYFAFSTFATVQCVRFGRSPEKRLLKWEPVLSTISVACMGAMHFQ